MNTAQESRLGNTQILLITTIEHFSGVMVSERCVKTVHLEQPSVPPVLHLEYANKLVSTFTEPTLRYSIATNGDAIYKLIDVKVEVHFYLFGIASITKIFLKKINFLRVGRFKN